jgi:hypothetical protein
MKASLFCSIINYILIVSAWPEVSEFSKFCSHS